VPPRSGYTFRTMDAQYGLNNCWMEATLGEEKHRESVNQGFPLPRNVRDTQAAIQLPPLTPEMGFSDQQQSINASAQSDPECYWPGSFAPIHEMCSPGNLNFQTPAGEPGHFPTPQLDQYPNQVLTSENDQTAKANPLVEPLKASQAWANPPFGHTLCVNPGTTAYAPDGMDYDYFTKMRPPLHNWHTVPASYEPWSPLGYRSVPAPYYLVPKVRPHNEGYESRPFPKDKNTNFGTIFQPANIIAFHGNTHEGIDGQQAHHFPWSDGTQTVDPAMLAPCSSRQLNSKEVASWGQPQVPQLRSTKSLPEGMQNVWHATTGEPFSGAKSKRRLSEAEKSRSMAVRRRGGQCAACKKGRRRVNTPSPLHFCSC
jgi:hypothetical protein